MAWWCDNCGNRMLGKTCGHKWRHKGKHVRCRDTEFIRGAVRIPKLDGMIYINDDGTGIPRQEILEYEAAPCRRGSPAPTASKGPRPHGWGNAMRRIGERSYQTMEEYLGCLPEC